MRNTILLLFLFLGFISCDSNRVFDQYKPIKNNVWLKNNNVLFSFEVTDTVSKNNLFITIRNDKNYEFSNLFLITKINFPNGFQTIDTLEYEMTDKVGNYLGTGFTDVKESKLFYKENVQFNQQGTYHFQVAQAMRKNKSIKGLDSLNGITDVGFRIEKVVE